MLCHKGKAVALSHDQTADLEEERNRIQAAGLSVKWRVDSWRIGEAGIQVTRWVSGSTLRRPGATMQMLPGASCILPAAILL